MKLHSLTKLCINTTASLCDARMMRSVFRREFIFHIDIMSNCRHFGTICVANFTIFRTTLDTSGKKSENLNNEAIWAGKGWTRSKSDFCFHMLESTRLGPFRVGQVHAGSWSNLPISGLPPQTLWQQLAVLSWCVWGEMLKSDQSFDNHDMDEVIHKGSYNTLLRLSEQQKLKSR